MLAVCICTDFYSFLDKNNEVKNVDCLATLTKRTREPINQVTVVKMLGSTEEIPGREKGEEHLHWLKL